jgi:hypothetical protein
VEVLAHGFLLLLGVSKLCVELHHACLGARCKQVSKCIPYLHCYWQEQDLPDGFRRQGREECTKH